MFSGPLTGRKVFAIFAGAFGVIILVNLTLAFNAVKTFSGLEVPNSYVASQTFDARRDAQEALGWTVTARVDGDYLHLRFTDADGADVRVASLAATVGRATTVAQDQTPEFTFNGSEYIAKANLGPGNWNIRLQATSLDKVLFAQRLALYVTE